MPVVLLVRHGQASFGADDYDVLSDLGRAQSEAAGAEVRRRQLRDPLLVCGTLRRQRDTALLLGLDAEPRVDGRWDEYDHLGLVERYAPERSLDGTSRGLQDVLDEALVRWTADAGGGFPAFRDGALAALDDVQQAGRDVVVVSSGGVIAAVAATLLGAGAEGLVPFNRVCVNAAITKVVVGRSGATLVAFNDHAHFEGAARHLVTYR